MRSETDNWLKLAKDDFDRANLFFNEKDYEMVCFFSQQTIEKALKAYLIKSQSTLVKSHDLENLRDRAAFNIYISSKLNRAYTESRYIYDDEPLPSEKYGESEAIESLRTAKETLNLTEERLKHIDASQVKEIQKVYRDLKPDDDILRKMKVMKKEVEKAIHLDKMYLFGSRARGDYRDDSDIDILIISEDFKGKKTYERLDYVRNIFDFFRREIWEKKPSGITEVTIIEKDIICLTPEELERQRNMITFIADAMEYAIEI